MLKLNLINPQQSDIPFKTLVFPDGQPHISLDLTQNAENTEGVNDVGGGRDAMHRVSTGELVIGLDVV